MRAFISISDLPIRCSTSRRIGLAPALIFCALAGVSLKPASALASGTDPGKFGERDEDFSGSPFTEYGEFSDGTDEEADTLFMQYGRLFGVSVGSGISGATGNRGQLWQGGFPVIDFKVHYWFDFNFALDLNFYNTNQYHDRDIQGRGHTDIAMSYLGADLKYYIDTKDLSATLSFANPYVLVGVGSYSKTENYRAAGTQDQDSAFGVGAGAGLEFVIKPRKAYFALEGKFQMAKFKDTNYNSYTGYSIPDLTGAFFNVTGSLLFTW